MLVTSIQTIFVLAKSISDYICACGINIRLYLCLLHQYQTMFVIEITAVSYHRQRGLYFLAIILMYVILSVVLCADDEATNSKELDITLHVENRDCVRKREPVCLIADFIVANSAPKLFLLSSIVRAPYLKKLSVTLALPCISTVVIIIIIAPILCYL